MAFTRGGQRRRSIRFEKACLEQWPPGHGGVERVGGQGEDDHQNEDGCARVPGGETRDRKAPQSVAHEKAYDRRQQSSKPEQVCSEQRKE